MNEFKYLDDLSDWKSKTPKEILKTRKGICYDTAVLQHYLLNKIGIENKIIFLASEESIIEGNGMLPTHLFVIHKEKNEWKWMEGSWEPYRKNNFSERNPNILISKVKKLMENENGKPYHWIEILNLPGYELKIGEYWLELIKNFSHLHQIHTKYK